MSAKRPKSPVGFSIAPEHVYKSEIINYTLQLQNYADKLEQAVVRLRLVVTNAKQYVPNPRYSPDASCEYIMDEIDEVLRLVDGIPETKDKP